MRQEDEKEKEQRDGGNFLLWIKFEILIKLLSVIGFITSLTCSRGSIRMPRPDRPQSTLHANMKLAPEHCEDPYSLHVKMYENVWKGYFWQQVAIRFLHLNKAILAAEGICWSWLLFPFCHTQKSRSVTIYSSQHKSASRCFASVVIYFSVCGRLYLTCWKSWLGISCSGTESLRFTCRHASICMTLNTEK